MIFEGRAEGSIGEAESKVKWQSVLQESFWEDGGKIDGRGGNYLSSGVVCSVERRWRILGAGVRIR